MAASERLAGSVTTAPSAEEPPQRMFHVKQLSVQLPSGGRFTPTCAPAPCADGRAAASAPPGSCLPCGRPGPGWPGAGLRASGAPRGQARQPGIVEIGGNAHALLLAEGDDVGLLAVDIGGIAGVDLELRGNAGLDAARAAGQTRGAVARSMPGRASSSNAVRRRPSLLMSRPWRAASLGVRVRLSSRRRPSSRAAHLRANASRRPAPMQPSVQSGRRQALVGIVGAQAQAVFGARGEHAIGLRDAARHQVVDHHAHIAVGARDEKIARRLRPPSARR